MKSRCSGKTETAKQKAGKTRLDVVLVERGLAASRQRAQALLLAGLVRVNGQRIEKAGTPVNNDAWIEIARGTPGYASRGGLKLAGALEDFAVLPLERVCLDVGSSTGGFTDCLLQHGARRVFAVDVTVDQLDWKLRNDPRVVRIEKNARYLEAKDLPESVDFVTMDLSFISATKVLAAVVPLASAGADFLILIKPQFELEKRDVGKGGIVRDRTLQQQAIDRVTRASDAAGLAIGGVRPSRLAGTQGNQEFFLHARRRE